MRREGADESNIQLSDVLCDFCRGPWSEREAMVEGHHGSCICGQCLTVAYTEVVLPGTAGESSTPSVGEEFSCTMCLEGPMDREAVGRPGEPGWVSPLYPQAAICRRCIKLAAGVLHKDKDIGWRKPQAAIASGGEGEADRRVD